MAQTTGILKVIKANLKAQGLTYVDVAKALDLTEASVKRLFAEQSFSLQRLDAVCALLDMEISDVIRQMNEASQHIEQLTPEQEREIAEDLKLMMVTVCAFNRWTVEEMISYYEMTHEECVGKLLKLDALGIIQLLANNRIKLMIAPTFNWIEGGPIHRFFQETVGREYFESDFQGEGEQLIVLNGMLSAPSADVFSRKLKRLKQEFIELSHVDSALDLEQRKGFTFVMAMRHWDYGLFEHLQR